jgi:hypothetical protein
MVLGVDEKIIDRMMHTESRYIYSDISRHIYPHFFLCELVYPSGVHSFNRVGSYCVALLFF